MRKSIPFEKAHGLGNDFVLVRAAAIAGVDVVSLVPSWSDRRRGIGADGIIVISEETGRALRMHVHNADGSTPEICGNGIRCVVLSWAARRGLARGEVTVLTDAGPKLCHFRDDQVTVDMGPARLEADNLPSRQPSSGPTQVDVEISGVSMTGLAVSMGNPHLILFADDWPPIDRAQAVPLEHHPAFPQAANVSFATEPRQSRVRVTVWERGVGFTQACGTAACATAVAAVASGRSPSAPLAIDLPGGTLAIEVSPDLQQVTMTGPAQLVYAGEVRLP